MRGSCSQEATAEMERWTAGRAEELVDLVCWERKKLSKFWNAFMFGNKVYDCVFLSLGWRVNPET